MKTYLLDDGDPLGPEIDLQAFLDDNQDGLCEQDQRDLLALQPGQEFVGGGGAWGVWVIRCVAAEGVE